MVNRAEDRDLRRQNRRLGMMLVMSLAVLYIIAIVGVIFLN
jgi:Tfp pilus assembly protein PilX